MIYGGPRLLLTLIALKFRLQKWVIIEENAYLRLESGPFEYISVGILVQKPSFPLKMSALEIYDRLIQYSTSC